jgi:hypothetical protein
MSNKGRPEVKSFSTAELSTVCTREPSSSNEKGSFKADTKSDDEVIVYSTGIVLAAIILALCLAVFLVALDQTIIATAIPRITDEFHSVKDIGWYGVVRPAVISTSLLWLLTLS